MSRTKKQPAITHKGKTYNFSTEFVEIQGVTYQTVIGDEIPVVMGVIETKNGYFDPMNYRLEGLTDDESPLGDDGRYDPFSKAGQKRIMDCLNDGVTFKQASERLNEALANNNGTDATHSNKSGGMNEPLWLRNEEHAGRCLDVIFEGNRRLANRKKNGVKFVTVLAYPDELSETQMIALVSQKHCGGFAEWSSFAKSKVAFDLKTIHKWTIEQITSHLQFPSEQATKKYINAFKWYSTSGFTDTREWSKFHHAYVPTLVRHFGYDDEAMEFDPLGRRSNAPGKTPEPLDVDEVAGVKTDFHWFCKLIEEKKLTDCRQSDGFLAKLVRHSNKSYAARCFEILHQKPVKVVGGNGHKTTMTKPAQKAWEFLNSCTEQGALNKKALDLLEELKKIASKATTLKPYRGQTAENLTLQGTIRSLQGECKNFAAHIADQEIDDEDEVA